MQAAARRDGSGCCDPDAGVTFSGNGETAAAGFWHIYLRSRWQAFGDHNHTFTRVESDVGEHYFCRVCFSDLDAVFIGGGRRAETADDLDMGEIICL